MATPTAGSRDLPTDRNHKNNQRSWRAFGPESGTSHLSPHLRPAPFNVDMRQSQRPIPIDLKHMHITQPSAHRDPSWSLALRAKSPHSTAEVIQRHPDTIPSFGMTSTVAITARESEQIQRQTGGGKRAYDRYQVRVPKSYTTLEEMYRLFERTVYGKEMYFNWNCKSYCDMSKNRGNIVPFKLLRRDVDSLTGSDIKQQRKQSKQDLEALTGGMKQTINAEVDRRYYETSGYEPGTKIKKGETGNARIWEQKLAEVMKERQALDTLPPSIQELMKGKGASFQPKDYHQLIRIADKLKQFRAEDFAAYKLLAIRATDDLDLFEKSVDMYLARKQELTEALAAQQQQSGTKEPTLKDALDASWQGLDESAIGTMSESDRYDLARQKTSELTAVQLQYMKDHPGATLKDFAKSATLMNTPETFSAIGKDLAEAASGDAEGWARFAAGAGAGAKLSGWLLAVAGVLYVASWLTGVGELATIAAAAGALLASTLTLSTLESELRIKAASKAKTPEGFKHNVEAAAAARANVIVGISLVVVAAVLHFTAKALFPKTLENVKTSLKQFRERVRIKGSIYKLKPTIAKEMVSRKAELVASSELAKKNALDAAKKLEGATTEQFVDMLEKGDGGFIDPSSLPADQKVNFRELLATPEGRAAIESYKQRLIDALKTDVVAEIDRLTQEYASRIDEFLQDVEAARTHDDMNVAADKLERALSEEHAKKFLAGEQEAITNKKLQAAAEEARKEAIAAKEVIEAKAKAKADADAAAIRSRDRTVILEGEADVVHESAQAKRFGEMEGGGRFRFLGNSSQGIEGFFTPAGSNLEIPVSLKDFSGTGKLPNIIGRVNKNAAQVKAAGYAGRAVLHATVRQVTVEQMAAFIEGGPIQRMASEGIFNRLVFECSDGIIEVTASGQVRR